LTIASSCHKCVVLLIKCYLIYSVNVSLIIFFYTMTFETKVSSVYLFQIAEINIYNSASPFNASYCISFSITKTWNSTSCIFKWTFLNENWIKLSLGYPIEIPNMYMLFGMRCDKKGKLSAHLMDRLCYIWLSTLLYLISLNLVKFNQTVPTPWNQKCLFTYAKWVHIFDRLRMTGHILRLRPLLSDIPSFYSSIRMCDENWARILRKRLATNSWISSCSDNLTLKANSKHRSICLRG
jgi:hypothetical protein